MSNGSFIDEVLLVVTDTAVFMLFADRIMVEPLLPKLGILIK